jgi:hypothetical protein
MAGFNTPQGITIDSEGKNLYVSDSGNNRIRAIDISTQVVSTVAGTGVSGFFDGTGTVAIIQYPIGIAFSNSTLYVGSNNRIRKIVLNPPTPATLSTDLSFVMKDNDTFAIQMWGPTTRATSWGGSMLLEKAAMIQGGGGRSVPVPPIPKLHKRSSIKLRKSSDAIINRPNTKKADRPLKGALANPEVHRSTSAKKPKSTNKPGTMKTKR